MYRLYETIIFIEYIGNYFFWTTCVPQLFQTPRIYFLCSYFVSSAKAIIPAACGAENDVPCNPPTHEDDKDVDI